MSDQPSRAARPSNFQVMRFVVILSFVCALILSVLAGALREPQAVAKELDKSKEMMIAARVFTHGGYFQLKEGEEYFPAKNVGDGVLEKTETVTPATSQDILEVYQRRFRPFLVDDEGNTKTFQEAGIDEATYIEKNRDNGYFNLPLKLIYKILPNEGEGDPVGYVIPVNGFGLWNAIYGFIAIEPDGETVIGISWYEQGETPGLGANIATAEWQQLFFGKKIFQPTPDGSINPETAPIGINVVKGKVSEAIGDIPKAKAAVDGMPGATITGNGVAAAYHENLAPYRPFFVKINEKNEGDNG